MKSLFILFLFLLVSLVTKSQVTGQLFDFSTNSTSGWGSGSSLLSVSASNGNIKISSNGSGPNSESTYFLFSSSPLDLSTKPYVSFKVKTTQALNLRVDLVDKNASVTNNSPIVREIKEIGDWSLVMLNFDGLFLQKSPSKSLISTNIIGVNIYINPGGTAFKGAINIDDLAFGTSAERSVGNGIPGIKLDQIGYYPNASKVAIASSTLKNNFTIQTASNEVVFNGVLGELKYFSQAKDCVKIADFTEFKTPGKYKVVVDGLPISPYFEIKNQVHHEIAKAALKYYYFNRLSTAIDQKYASKWARAAGHPDNVVYVHSSAASLARPENTVLSAQKGWYDAGDYNKYIVNSGISTYTLMALYERFWPIYDTLNLNIPESGNEIPDILDEVKWNLDWMLAMQDPNDGGVYFKLTSKNFSGDIMPKDDKSARYMVGKSTSSALDFAATMAMAYRIFKPYNQQLQGYADTCILKAHRAYLWAKENKNIYFYNPTDINTGAYGDTFVGDEFAWAASELYISSQDDSFYADIDFSIGADIPGWQSVSTLGFLSLSHNINHLTEIADKENIFKKIGDAVLSLKSNFENTAYKMPMSSGRGNDFYWGSNSVAANQSLVLLQDYYNTEDKKSYEAAKSNLEYLLGRNPLDYCFVTGFGTKSPMNPHHRPSVADGIKEPVPGMLVGGPNDRSSGENGCVYPSTLPAMEYVDQSCSYSTNEIAINWNAPLSFILGAIEAEEMGVKPAFKFFEKGYPLVTNKSLSNEETSVFPNPAKDFIQIELNPEYILESIEIFDLIGNKLEFNYQENKLNIKGLKNGVYLLVLASNKGRVTKKIIVQQ